MKYILFDLDGTLTDPFIGITKSVSYALKSMNITPPPLEQLKPFIGPPLDDSFIKYYGMNNNEAIEAINKFREYFNKTGKFENKVYPQIDWLLDTLNKEGYTLYVCTSKPVVFAREIIQHFNLSLYFKEIYGSEFDGTRKAKKDVIAYCLNKENISYSDCIMIGDRLHDIVGAHDNGIKCIGVLYGYGNLKEFREYHCDYVVNDLYELLDLINSLNP